MSGLAEDKLSTGMDLTLAVLAGVAATAFTWDLAIDHRRRPRPHVAAYAVGMAMFAAATWALAIGLGWEWSGPVYRIFFLFGAVLNILYLALGSMYLVVGRRSGTVMFLAVGAISAIATTLVTTVRFDRPLPAGGIPAEIFPPIADGFGPRLLAAIGGGLGGSILILLALVSVFRFWRSDRRIIVASLLIMAGTLAAATGGTIFAVLDESSGFALSLLLAVSLIWFGYRVTRSHRSAPGGQLTVVLIGPSIESPERAHAEMMILGLERYGFTVVCPARDIEDWGSIGFTPSEAMRLTLEAIDNSQAVVVDLAQGYGVVAAGYARGKGIPVVVAAPEGERIPRPLRGVATLEVYYRSAEDVGQAVLRMLGLAAPEGAAAR